MGTPIKVADEVWIGCALLHYENPHRADFTVGEIVERVARENISGTLRPGVSVHVHQHCVANRPANPGNHRMLYETRPGHRRLWRLGDDFHPSRVSGKTCPRASDIPARYHHLLQWYERWGTGEAPDLGETGVLPRAGGETAPGPSSGEEGGNERTGRAVSSTLTGAQEFEALAREAMSKFFGVPLSPGTHPGVPKRFDMVSPDRSIIGDAKYYALVRGTQIPPAKFSAISEHVWLLEKTRCNIKFLVFGNDRRVPEEWLERYGHLVADVQFFFLDPGSGVVKLR